MCLTFFFIETRQFVKNSNEICTAFLSYFFCPSRELGLGFSVVIVTFSAPQNSNFPIWKMGKCFFSGSCFTLSFQWSLHICTSREMSVHTPVYLLEATCYSVLSSWWRQGSWFFWSSPILGRPGVAKHLHTHKGCVYQRGFLSILIPSTPSQLSSALYLWES